MEPAAPPIYRVGDLLIDAGQARVTRGDGEIPLPKLSFDLLLALIRAAPRIASTDELMERVWPGLVVSPETVSQRISLVRAALGDDPKEPRYIAVVRGRGYRLVAEVLPVPPAAMASVARASEAPLAIASAAVALEQASGTDPIAMPSAAGAARPRRVAVAAVAAILAALVVVFAFRAAREPMPRPNASIPERSIAVLPFESVGSAPDVETLALGIPEAVLHQLATVREISVVARRSSFVFRGRNEDPREIGRKLGARYLLAGSVQYESQKIRVTAQLIDGTTGGQVWSVRIDKAAHNIFALQDEIALEVARALKLSLDATTTDKLTGQGTASFDAYLAYLQGRAHAATLRIPDAKLAVAEFGRAIRIDPTFAAAYVELAEAELLVAEFDLGEDRQDNFARAIDHGKTLIEHALQLDPANGHAYVERAYFKAFTDLAGAEADYRRGIALSPSYATAYAGLASVLYENPTRWAEALEALDRARKLDPLAPQYDVTKAVFLLYRRSDIKAANDLLVDVLQREPLYQPALMRLGELRWHFEGRPAEAIRYGEQALQLDAFSEWSRRYLTRAYLDLEDPAGAARVVATAPRALAVRSIPLHVYRHEWIAAGEAVYEADDDETLSPIDESIVSPALRMHARATRQFARAIALLERLADVTWTADGQPQLPKRLGGVTATVSLADMLIQNGERPRAERLLRATLADMEHGAKDLQRGEFWYMEDRPMALALLGDSEGAMHTLQRVFTARPGITEWWFTLEADPVYESLRADPRFKRLRESAQAHARDEREALAKLRAEGLVPTGAR